ncbi:hypothetical protein DERP_010522 [Dermatophagoides pteronyssinus]|uniref:Uncharacterized protein n=1 Tax=Dermatophagoides pteronyssinus TaxID=6956 RepID=A0ABQ8JFI1_DERPT|nr:hypothetical protein DERP_010522 [Dermatophagoides pteronyssinus]
MEFKSSAMTVSEGRIFCFVKVDPKRANVHEDTTIYKQQQHYIEPDNSKIHDNCTIMILLYPNQNLDYDTK